jgi:DNA polymerase-1
MSSDTTTYSLTSPSDLPRLEGATVIFDTEGTGVDKLRDKATLALVRVGGQNWAAPWTEATARWVEDEFPRAALVVAHYAKHDYHMCLNGGVSADALYRTRWSCSIIESVLCDDNRFSYKLDDLGAALFGKTKSHQLYRVLAERFGGPPTVEAQAPRIGLIDVRRPSRELSALVEYGFQDLTLTDRLHEHWKPQIEREGLGGVLALERRAIGALIEMERRGVPLFGDRVGAVRSGLEVEAAALQEKIIKLTGRRINPRSPTDMLYAFTALGLPVARTSTGRPSFNKEVLARFQDHEFVRSLTDARSVKTILDTFINSAISGHLVDGRIHTTFNQVKTEENGARTGRLSSSDPNLQQVPSRDGKLAPLVRGLFGHPNFEWLCGDWEQFEFRVFGHYSNDPNLIRVYRDNPETDFHQAVADLTNKPRGRAKSINLGLVFGMGEGKLAKELGLPYTTEKGRNGREYLAAGPEAQALFADYHERFPGARQMLTRAANLARSRGWVKTLRGRRLRFPNGGEHKAGGLVFQGTSADLMKEKVVVLNDRYRKSDVQFILVVHDEFDFLCPHELAVETRKEVKGLLEDIPDLRIPIRADVNTGADWWKASKGA